MKTPRIQGLQSKKNIQATQKLARTQTNAQKAVSGPSQPVMQNIEPAVVDVKYFKDKWNKLVRFFREK